MEINAKLDTAIKFGAGRYRQERNLLPELGEEFARFGKRIFIVTNTRSWAAVSEKLEPGLKAAGLEYHVEMYGGWCSYEGARRLADAALAWNADEIVGVGGGKLVDIAKAAGEYASLGVITVATSASTCAPFTCMSVMYTEDGANKNCWRSEHELDGVYVDLDVIAACPIRYNAAGILDAMAKKIEILNGRDDLDLADTKIDLYCAFNWASWAYDVLEKHGKAAIEDNRAGKATELVEDMTFVNVAATGVIANITKSFNQSHLAHDFYYCARTLFTKESAPYIHGEIVAVALFMQLFYNRTPEQEEGLREYMRSMDMPLALGEIGIKPTEENLNAIEEFIRPTRGVIQTEEGYARLHDAIREMV